SGKCRSIEEVAVVPEIESDDLSRTARFPGGRGDITVIDLSEERFADCRADSRGDVRSGARPASQRWSDDVHQGSRLARVLLPHSLPQSGCRTRCVSAQISRIEMGKPQKMV